MVSASYLLSKLKPFTHTEDIKIHDQSVGDIISGVLERQSYYGSEYDKICSNFLDGGIEKVPANIWDFLKKNVKYKAEPDTWQLLKSPAAIIATGKTTGSDCKNYSLFTAGILSALNRRGYKINWCFRFASYDITSKIPGHVFVVVNPGAKKEIWIDAVLPHFDQHKSYCYKQDKKVNDMSLVYLSGIGDASVGLSFKKSKAHKAADKKKRQEKFKKIKKDINKVKGVVLKYSIANLRNPFLVVVKLNFRSVATNLAKALKKDPDKIHRWWRDLGGDENKLNTAISQGAKQKRLGKVGEPVTVAAAAAASAPLLIKIAQILKEMGIDGKDILKAGTDLVKAKAKTTLNDISAEAAGKTTPTGDATVVADFKKANPRTGAQQPGESSEDYRARIEAGGSAVTTTAVTPTAPQGMPAVTPPVTSGGSSITPAGGGGGSFNDGGDSLPTPNPRPGEDKNSDGQPDDQPSENKILGMSPLVAAGAGLVVAGTIYYIAKHN